MINTNKERYEIQNMVNRVDYISQLPDVILHHILSFIPTKDVVKTSILSKRYTDLWTSVSNLDFDDALLYTNEINGRDPPEETCFMNFIERVLLLRDTSNINNFRLSCRVCFNASRIHSWISAAILRNVHNLNLCIFVDDTFILPRSIFCNKSLTSLKIEMNCVLELPNSINLPNLKMLHLSLVTFPNDESTQNLFVNCPTLEELVMLDCEWTNSKYVMILSSTLKRLTIDDLPYFGPPDCSSGCKIMINTPNLVCLKYTGYLLNEIFLFDLSSLVKAYVSVPIPHEKQKEIASNVVNLLRGLQNLVSLRVSDRTIESLVIAGNMVNNLPIFVNLTHLELSMEIGNATYEGLLKLLNRCPNLQSLYFAEGFNHDVRLVKNDLIKCMPSRLKMLTIKNFDGYDSEICFLKCVLQHALVSDKINIYCYHNMFTDLNRTKEIKKALDTIARGSTSCVVTWF